MRTVVLVLFVATCCALVGCGKAAPPAGEPVVVAPGPPAPPDRDRFQGVWKIQSADTGQPGKELSRQNEWRLEFQGDRLRMRTSPATAGELYAAVWDEATQPRTLALTPLGPDGKPAGDKQVWIYKFEGDAPVVAFTPGGKPPKDFVADASAAVIVLRLSKTNEPPTAFPGAAGP